MVNWVLSVLALALVFSPYLASPVPNADQDNQKVQDDVKELESLRTEIAKPTNSNDVHGESPEVHPAPESASEEDSQSKSRSGIFRHRGITQAKKSKYWNEKPSEGYAKFPGIQYSPADLAMYVFNTGDEEGVAVAVEQLVREGMMGRTDAIAYLQDVKQILTYMRDMRDQLQGKKMDDFDNVAYPKQHLTQRLPNIPREQFISALDNDKRDSHSLPAAPSTTEPPKQVAVASTTEPKEPTDSTTSTTAQPKAEGPPSIVLKEEDSKRRVQSKNSYDFTLEVIYKLAKDMFTQSIMRDDPTAEDTLSGLVTFLENEVGNKRISPHMKEQVLEVVSSALVDALRDYQGYVSEKQSFDDSGLYRRDANGYNSKVPISEMYRKLSADGHENMLQLTPKSNRPKSS